MRSDQSPTVAPARECFRIKSAEPPRRGARKWGTSGWRHGFAGLVFAAAFTCFAQDAPPAVPSPQPGVAPQTQSTSPASAKPVADPLDKPLTEEAAPEPTESSPAPAQPVSTQLAPMQPETQQHKQVSVESTQLLAMAVALKAEVDKTNKDMLSINVIRKADAIERLAKTVKEKMKVTVSAN